MTLKNLNVDLSVLLVIDIQNDFCHEQGAFAKMGMDLSHIQSMIPRLNFLIEQIRTTNIPIIFIKNIYDRWTMSNNFMEFKKSKGRTINICEPKKWGSDFYEIEPNLEGNEVTLVKHRYSAFRDSELDLILRSIGRKILLISGVTTNICVESTARDGFMRDYQIFLLEDCTAATSIEEHESAISNIRNYFGYTITSENILSLIK